jgi:hypothetical protein
MLRRRVPDDATISRLRDAAQQGVTRGATLNQQLWRSRVGKTCGRTISQSMILCPHATDYSNALFARTSA